MRLPLEYHDSVGFGGWFTASPDAVAALLPSPRLRSARWFDGRALVSVDVFRHRDTTWTDGDGRTRRLAPYGEVGISVGVTLGPAPRGLPAVRERIAGLVLHLPVTSREARDAGRSCWGLPKFVADMDFLDAPDRQQVTVGEDGVPLLTLAVVPRGPLLRVRRPLTVYSARAGALVETTWAVRAHRQLGPGGATLSWGGHPLAEELRRLDVRPRALASFRYVEHRGTLPAGRVVAPADEHPGHRGADRDLGRFTVRHPGTDPLDQYVLPTAPDGPVSARDPEPAWR